MISIFYILDMLQSIQNVQIWILHASFGYMLGAKILIWNIEKGSAKWCRYNEKNSMFKYWKELKNAFLPSSSSKKFIKEPTKTHGFVWTIFKSIFLWCIYKATNSYWNCMPTISFKHTGCLLNLSSLCFG